LAAVLPAIKVVTGRDGGIVEIDLSHSLVLFPDGGIGGGLGRWAGEVIEEAEPCSVIR
jgi:hypothetical protein